MTTLRLLLPILGLALASCSSTSNPQANHPQNPAQAEKKGFLKSIGDSTNKAFAKLPFRKDELKVVKADPNKYLPQGTLVRNGRPLKPQEPKHLLAQHKTTRGHSSKPLDPLPDLELPPLPSPSDTTGGPLGILPSLDGTDTPTTIESDAPAPEMPELEIPAELLEDTPEIPGNAA
ncbi:MAG: hypothetical protein AAGC74_09080 [Verrucomicrobiota bacterium]